MSDTQLAARLGVRPCERVSDADPWCQVHDSIWRSGSRPVCDDVLDLLDMAERGMDLVTRILRDLIAELRDRAAYASSEPLAELADRAEQRLKGLSDE